MARKPKGPGLKKTRELTLGARRTLELWQAADYLLRELFETADVMSEGATRNEPEGATYYGSTSVLLPWKRHGGLVPEERALEIARLVESDPHARLRAIRIACLEAQVRSGAPIGRVRAELYVDHDERGIRVGVDVEARVFEVERVGGRGGELATNRPSRKPPRAS